VDGQVRRRFARSSAIYLLLIVFGGIVVGYTLDGWSGAAFVTAGAGLAWVLAVGIAFLIVRRAVAR
jgi:hypothetical protein